MDDSPNSVQSDNNFTQASSLATSQAIKKFARKGSDLFSDKSGESK